MLEIIALLYYLAILSGLLMFGGLIALIFEAITKDWD